MDTPITGTNEPAAPAAKPRASLARGLAYLAASVGIGLLLALFASAFGLVSMELAQLAPPPPGAHGHGGSDSVIQHAP